MKSMLIIFLTSLFASPMAIEDSIAPEIVNDSELVVVSAWFATTSGSTVSCLSPGNTYLLYAKFHNSLEPCMCVETLTFPGATPPSFISGNCRDISTSGYYNTSVRFTYYGGNVTFTVKEGCGYPYNNSGNYLSLVAVNC